MHTSSPASAHLPSDHVAGEPLPAVGQQTKGAVLRRRIGAYVALTKPRVIELLLVTTIPTMMLAEGGFPSLWLVLATLVGGAAAAGASGVLNCYIDRDIDEKMNRTKRRPIVTGEVSPRNALIFGLVLAAVHVISGLNQGMGILAVPFDPYSTDFSAFLLIPLLYTVPASILRLIAWWWVPVALAAGIAVSNVVFAITVAG